MNSDKLFKEYYIEFGEFPNITTTTDENNEKLLKAVENAIKTKKPLTDEDYDKIFSEPYDLVVGKNKKLHNFGKKKGEKNDTGKRD